MTSPVTTSAWCSSPRRCGVDLRPGAIVAGAFVAIAVSVGSVGLPGEISFIASVAPIAIAGRADRTARDPCRRQAIPDVRTRQRLGDMAATVITSRGGVSQGRSITG
jgi:hypothetical protein